MSSSISFSHFFPFFFFLSRCCPLILPSSLSPNLLLSLSATMATAKDYPGPTTGKYPPHPQDNRSEPDLHCAMLDLDLGQDTSRRPHSMSQTITMHGCSHCWRQLLSLQPCQRLHKWSHNMFGASEGFDVFVLVFRFVFFLVCALWREALSLSDWAERKVKIWL